MFVILQTERPGHAIQKLKLRQYCVNKQASEYGVFSSKQIPAPELGARRPGGMYALDFGTQMLA